eukprot:826225-Prorocentrum_minimum.AAC.1
MCFVNALSTIERERAQHRAILSYVSTLNSKGDDEISVASAWPSFRDDTVEEGAGQQTPNLDDLQNNVAASKQHMRVTSPDITDGTSSFCLRTVATAHVRLTENSRKQDFQRSGRPYRTSASLPDGR